MVLARYFSLKLHQEKPSTLLNVVFFINNGEKYTFMTFTSKSHYTMRFNIKFCTYCMENTWIYLKSCEHSYI